MRELIEGINDISRHVAEVFIMQEELLYPEQQDQFRATLADTDIEVSFSELSLGQLLAMNVVCMREIKHKLHKALEAANE